MVFYDALLSRLVIHASLGLDLPCVTDNDDAKGLREYRCRQEEDILVVLAMVAVVFRSIF